MKAKLFIPFIFVLIFAGCGVTHDTVKVRSNQDTPKNVLFLSQSGTQVSMYQTVIDLDNNELVVIEYLGNELKRIYRTGITVNPDHYLGKQIIGTDMPFGKSSMVGRQEM